MCAFHRLSRHGSQFGSVEIRPTGGGYGVFATAPIAVGDMLVTLPPSLAMNELSAIRSLHSPEFSNAITPLLEYANRGASSAIRYWLQVIHFRYPHICINVP